MDTAQQVDGETASQWLETADSLFKIKMQLKRLRENDATISKKLKELSGGKTAKRGRYEYTCSARRGPINYATVPQLQGVNLEPYRKSETKTWKLQVVE